MESNVKIKVVLDEGAYLPSRAHKSDAGFDLRARVDLTVPANSSVNFDTGVHVAIPEGYVGFLKAKSGLNCKHSILSTGVIDSGYTGSIVVKLYNESSAPYHVCEGDKITQLVILPIPDVAFEQVDSLEDTERGVGGFGSTGR